MFHRIAIAAALAAAAIAPAQAGIMTGSYSVKAYEGLTNGIAFDTTNGNPFSGTNTASATITYSGPIAFSNPALANTGQMTDLNTSFGFSTTNITAYSGSGAVVSSGQTVADFSTLSTFLSSSGSAATFTYGSYYEVDLGIVAAGTVLSITHDDGISVYQGTTRVGANASSGATSVRTNNIRVHTTGDTILRYARENGTPSILQVAIPEPMSLGLLGASLAGVGLIRRRRQG